MSLNLEELSRELVKRDYRITRRPSDFVSGQTVIAVIGKVYGA